MDATASIVEIGLLDKQTAGHEASAPSKHACTLMYAMAVTRLVNGITDPLQQAARASSVKHLAQSVGLPPSLVELRHDCTHNRLPSLDRLRVAATKRCYGFTSTTGFHNVRLNRRARTRCVGA